MRVKETQAPRSHGVYGRVGVDLVGQLQQRGHAVAVHARVGGERLPRGLRHQRKQHVQAGLQEWGGVKFKPTVCTTHNQGSNLL